MGRYTYLPIRYYHDTWVTIRYVLHLYVFKNVNSTSIVIRYSNVLQCFFAFFFFTLESRPWGVNDTQYTDCQNKKTQLSSYYCNSILQFIVIFVCLLKTRQWTLVDYTLTRDCI